MMIEITPQKQHARIATTSKKPPQRVPLYSLTEPPPQPLGNKTFVISGNITERNDAEKLTTEKLKGIIESLGGRVYDKDIEKAIEAEFIVITSQKELNKPVIKLNKTITMAYRLGWPIVSKQFVRTARDTNVIPDVGDYSLDLTNIKNAPSTSVVHAKVKTRGGMVDNFHIVGAHRELKKKLRNKKALKADSTTCNPKKNKIRKVTGYVMFSKEMFKEVVKNNPNCSMREANSLVSQMWKELDQEQKDSFKQLANQNYEELLVSLDTRNI